MNYRRYGVTRSAPGSWVIEGPPIEACFSNPCSASKQNLLRTFPSWEILLPGAFLVVCKIHDMSLILSEV